MYVIQEIRKNLYACNAWLSTEILDNS